MTTFLIYLCGIVDSIKCAFSIVSIFTLIGVIISWAITISDEYAYRMRIAAICLSALLFFTGTIALFTPNSKTVAAMLILPKLADNQQIQGITQNGMEALELLTRKWVKELVEEDNKK